MNTSLEREIKNLDSAAEEAKRCDKWAKDSNVRHNTWMGERVAYWGSHTAVRAHIGPEVDAFDAELLSYYEQQWQSKDRVRELLAALERNPDFTPDMQLRVARILQLHEGDYAPSPSSFLRRCLQRYPGNKTLRQALIEALIAEKSIDSAIELLKGDLRATPDNTEIPKRIAGLINTLIDRKLYSSALKWLKQDLERTPEDVALKRRIADLMLKDRKVENALSFLDTEVAKYAEDSELSQLRKSVYLSAVTQEAQIVADHLGKHPDPMILEHITAMFSTDSDENRRRGALVALALVHGPTSLWVIDQGLDDPGATVGAAAVDRLAQWLRNKPAPADALKDADILPLIRKALTSRGTARTSAIWLLTDLVKSRHYAIEAVWDMLMLVLRDPDDAQACSPVIAALQQATPELQQWLVSRLKTERDGTIKKQIMLLLGEIDPNPRTWQERLLRRRPWAKENKQFPTLKVAIIVVAALLLLCCCCVLPIGLILANLDEIMSELGMHLLALV